MSIFASQVTATHAFTCDPSQSFTVRKLTWIELRETQAMFAQDVKAWAYRVMELALTHWTYDAPLDRGSFDAMVDEAVDQVTTAALKLTKPSAFETEPEAAQKND
jgi:hypothetical protein